MAPVSVLGVGGVGVQGLGELVPLAVVGVHGSQQVGVDGLQQVAVGVVLVRGGVRLAADRLAGLAAESVVGIARRVAVGVRDRFAENKDSRPLIRPTPYPTGTRRLASASVSSKAS